MSACRNSPCIRASRLIGVRDVTLATRALKAFYNADLRIDGADSIELD